MDKQLEGLESVLTQQAAAHEKMLALMQQKRQALRDARHDRVTQCSEEENTLVQVLGALEKTRLKLIGELTLAVNPSAKEPMRLLELADHLPEPQRGRLLVLRQQLQERMLLVKQETAVVRRAIESLVRHMQGLVQTVGSVVTGVGLYGNHGAPPKDTLAVSTFQATG